MKKEKTNTRSRWSKFTDKLRAFPWKADGQGGVAGIIAGGIKGGIAGPVGLGIGAGLGAVGGAIGNSVKDIIFPPKGNKRDFEAEEKEKRESLKKILELKAKHDSRSKPKEDNK